MPPSKSETLVRRYIQQVWNRANMQVLDELATEAYTYHLGGQPPRDTTAMQQFVEAVHVAFPDWRVEIEDIIADEDSVAVRWTGEVTHQGVFHGIPATGKRLSVCGINVYRIEEGKISAEWEQMDSVSMLQQLGVLPPPDPSTGD